MVMYLHLCRLATVVVATFLAILIYFFLTARPNHIQLEGELSCEVTSSAEAYAKFMETKIKPGHSIGDAVSYLYRHGYYLRNIAGQKFHFISHGDGSVCFFRKFAVDTSMITIVADEDLRVISIGG